MQTKQEISHNLEPLFSEISKFGASLSEEVARADNGEGVWTILQEYNHVVLSTAPIAKVMMFDQERFLSKNFTDKEEMEYSVIEQRYWDLIRASQAKAPARFSELHEEVNIQSLTELWNDLAKEIVSRIPSWSEDQLSKAKLQHPLLGDMTLREMLFFTHMHCSHHLQRMKEKARKHSAL